MREKIGPHTMLLNPSTTVFSWRDVVCERYLTPPSHRHSEKYKISVQTKKYSYCKLNLKKQAGSLFLNSRQI